MKSISTANAPIPIGHYSQATVSSGLIFISGQLAFDPVTGEKVVGSIEAEALQVLHNLEEILKAAGVTRNAVVKATIYLSDMNFWGQVNHVYGEFFGSHRPARAIVPIRELPAGFHIEIEAIADATSSA